MKPTKHIVRKRYHWLGTLNPIATEYYVYNGKKHGKYISRYSNGELCIECNYKNGSFHGLYKSLTADGRYNAFLFFKDGRQFGQIKCGG
jgi:antitoxin component YwqK of YwqJK toxin-antitoxin module